ncbi:unnamed protein product [Owenia fusiformis]|uniref:Uncharacterized protein n=1 Tax=Owenia fusiformis TaxID=6347 RepID=A0A8J1TYA1_OWEFU|nr:unnamed protein product [Owenia fusiformis]
MYINRKQPGHGWNICSWTACLIVLLWMSPTTIALTDKQNNVVSNCDEGEPVCEFWLELEHGFTMTKQVGSKMLPVIIQQNGSIYHRSSSGDKLVPIADNDTDSIVYADGSYQLIMMVNKSMPGPPMVVYEGQEVVVHVTNLLTNEATTIHWHGLEQRNTPWMDGVGSVSQCPINPYETFTYRFIASNIGTNWYHAHLGTQRSAGIFGSLVVLERPKDQIRRRGADQLPEFLSDHHMIVQDWTRRDSLYVSELISIDAANFAYGFDKNRFSSTKQVDGVDAGIIPFISALVNGKGYHHISPYDSQKIEKRGLPIEVFHVNPPSTDKGGAVRFRLINAAMYYAFRVSIDYHQLHVISTDGNHVITTTVQSVIVYGGERYDFWINATDPLGVGNYWVRFETLERYVQNKTILPGRTYAILRYKGANKRIPQTDRRPCRRTNGCKVLNCPYKYYPKGEYTTCIPVADLRDSFPTPTLSPETEKFTQKFLNFHFSGFHSTGRWLSTINGRQHQQFSSPVMIQPEIMAKASQKMCPATLKHGEDGISCTHIIDLPLGHIIQITLLTTVSPPLNGVLNGNVHPIHIHGHNFQVVKMGFPRYDPITGRQLEMNKEFNCTVDDNCNDGIVWADPSWNSGDIPGMTKEGPPLKDTVLVPVGGYVVIRFRADNPGFWYSHCHIEFHNEEGMALIFKAGDVSDMNTAPSNMKTCGNFEFSGEEFQSLINNRAKGGPKTTSKHQTIPEPAVEEILEKYEAIIIALGVTSLILMCCAMYQTYRLWKSRKISRGGYHRIDERDEDVLSTTQT